MRCDANANDTDKAQIKSLALVEAIMSRVFNQATIERIRKGGASFAERTNGYAKMLAGALFSVTLGWGLLMGFFTKTPPMEVFMECVVFLALSLLLLEIYPAIANDLWMLSKLVAGEDLAVTISKFISTMLGAIIAAIQSLLISLFTLRLDYFTAAIPSFLALVVAIFFAFLAIIELIGIAFTGPVFFAAGFALGPLFCASIASHYTRRWFDQWLNFMIASAFMTTIAVVVLTILATVLSDFSTSFSSRCDFSSGEVLGLALLMASVSKLFAGVPQITDAMFPGRTGAGQVAARGKDIVDRINPAEASKSKNAIKQGAVGAFNAVPYASAAAGAVVRAVRGGIPAAAMEMSKAASGVAGALDPRDRAPPTSPDQQAAEGVFERGAQVRYFDEGGAGASESPASGQKSQGEPGGGGTAESPATAGSNSSGDQAAFDAAFSRAEMTRDPRSLSPSEGGDPPVLPWEDDPRDAVAPKRASGDPFV